MQLHFEPMSDVHANAIVAWRYEPPYDLYDLDASAVASLIDPASGYIAGIDEERRLVGFGCFGREGQVPGGCYDEDLLDVGVGLRPDLTGHGLGPPYLAALLAYGLAHHAPTAFRATVAAFNRRSIRACEHAGFRVVDAFKRGNEPDGMPFVMLTWTG